MFGFGTPKEVRDTLAALAVAEEELNKGERTAVGTGNLWNEVRQLARQKHHTIDAIRNEGWTAEELSWQIIANASWEALVTGRHHTYRGTVGVSGMALQPIFAHAIRRLRELGRLTEEEASSELARLSSEIRKVG